jgi:predicted MFS family arabinose efflux permease
VLAFSPAATVAAATYAALMAFQFMSEPGMFTLLMSRVEEGERAGVSAINHFVMSGSQAAAAGVGGMAVTHFGYARVLASAAGIAALAACLFRLLVHEGHTDSAAHPQLPPIPLESAHKPDAVEGRTGQQSSSE